MATYKIVTDVTTAELAALVSASGLEEGLQYKETTLGQLLLATSANTYRRIDGITVLSGGNVGIGTTGPHSKLFVAGGELMVDYATGGTTNGAAFRVFSNSGATYWASNQYYDSSSKHARAGGGAMIKMDTGTGATAGDITFYTSPNGAADGVWITHTAMTIKEGGNVGIGTTTPANKLDVEGAAAIGATYSGVSIAPANGLIVEGNVGIGTASPTAGYKLDVAGNIILSSGYLVIKDTTWGLNIQDNVPISMGDGVDFSLGSDGTKAYWSVGTYLASATGMTMDGSGNVGIGTTSPTAVLHLKAGTATASTAPIKLTAGVNLTTPENGALEFDGTNLYFTSGGTRKTITMA